MKTLRVWERSKHAFVCVVVLPLAFACGKSESFKSLEETKALLSQTDSKAPLLTHPNEKQQLFTEETLILDFNNEKSGNDDDMSYSCFYDQVIDGTVAEAISCDGLPGGSAQKLDAATGKFLWGPLENTSSYELRFIGKNKVGSDSLILTVEVLQNRKPKLDPINDIGIAALKTVSVIPVNKRDPGTATVTYSCRFDKIIDEKISDSLECKNLPGDPAIKFDATSGTLSWIPPESAVGSYEFEIKAENTFGSDVKLFSINVGVSEVKKITLSFIRDQSLVVGDTLSLDVNNTITSSDDGVTYTCHYDSLADGVVNELLSCDLLPGTPTQKFNPLTGALNWTPSLTGNTELEIRIKGTKQGDSDTQVFVVSLATQRFGDVGNSAIVFDPTSWDFGSLALNDTSTAKSVTITNNASADVYIGSFTSTLSDFIINWNSCPVPPQKLASLATCILNVSFRPTTSGSLGGSVVVRFGKTATATSDYNSVLGLSGRGVGTLVFAGLDSISNITHTSLRLNWTANAAAGSFLIFRVNGSALEYIETILNTGGALNSKTINNLTPSTNYTYRVRATDFVGVVDNNTQNRNATTLANTEPNLSDGPAGWQVYSGRVITAIDINDNSNSIDYDADGDPISYTCHYDNSISGDVNTGTAATCASLANIGSGSATFNQYTGTFSGWKPRVTDENIQFEFKIVGTDTNGASDAVIFSTTVINGAPTITNVTDKVFPSTYLNATDNFAVDFNNIRDSLNNDTDMTYTCTYKNLTTTDSSSASCSGNLPGTFSLSSTSGSFSWLPGNSGAGAYEISVTGTLAVGGSTVGISTRTFKASVMPDIDDTARLFHIDARFADQKRGGQNVTDPATLAPWLDLTGSGDHGIPTDFNVASAWTGSASASNPMALSFDGNNDWVDFSEPTKTVDFPTKSALHFDAWIFEGANTRERVIFSTGDSAEKGLILTNKRFWLGNGTNTAYSTAVTNSNPSFYWRLDSSVTIADTMGGNANPGLVNGGGSVTANDDGVFNLSGASVQINSTARIIPTTPPIIGNDFTLETWFFYPFPGACSGGRCTLVRSNDFSTTYQSTAVTVTDMFATVDRTTMNLGIWKQHNVGTTPANGFISSGYSLQGLDRGWHHMAVVGSGGNSVQFYIDGSPVGSAITSYFPRGRIYYVGNENGANNSFGRIDDFAYYTHALTAPTIAAHYSAGHKSHCYFSLNEGYWYHLAGALEDTTDTGTLYMNGAEACSFTKPSSSEVYGSATALSIAKSTSSSSTWLGKLSSLIFYDDASTSNITTNYSATTELYSPQLPIAPAGLKLWVRSDLGLWQDSVGGLPANADGHPVAVWEDQSGAGGDFSVRTSIAAYAGSARPTLNTNVLNGKAVISFDGGNDNLQNIVNYGFPNTVFVVGRYNGSSPRGRVVTGTYNNWFMGWDAGTVDDFYPGAWVYNSSASGTTNWYIYSTDHTASVQRIFRNTQLQSSNNTGSQGPNGLTLGSRGFNAGATLIDASVSQIAEIIVYDRVLSDAERNAVFSYLNTRYGVY